MTTRASDAVTTHRDASPQSRALYWAARATLRQVYRVWPLTDAGIRGLAAVERGFTRLPHPAGVNVDQTTLGGVPAVTIAPESIHPELAGPEAAGPDAMADVAVLYLHGGAFVFCGPSTHRRLCSSLATGLGAPVHSVKYRKLPEVDIGAVVDDVYRAYRALSAQLPAEHRIVVAGDSAGGFLAAKLCELAARDGTRRPAALVGYSPLVDLDGDLSDGSWFTRDAYQPASTVRRAQQLWASRPHQLPGCRSMLDCDPAVFPPTLITLAAGELVETAALALTERLHAAGRTVGTHRWHTAVHAFPVLDALTPESKRAGELTVEFLRRVLGG
ncbi:alpha/beta hydrolase [Dietzia psychralcaliphila]|uniref:alpha/beta hydrolase n=1 Tax=Dietzia psychralcaliphila TaxID=139021 RepID=UPI001C1E78A0|nr:alpha/beta hydrolase [Dietzia psychralcaliphila]